MIKTIPSKEPGEILRLSGHTYTYDDLREMPESMEHIEIIDGVLYMSPSSHVMRHQGAVSNLLFLLKTWVDRHGLGEVFTAPADVVAAPTKVVQPDLFFVATERLHIVDAYVDGAPDLVVEVLSPSSIQYDRRTKFGLYEEIGVEEYWIVDPDGQTVEVYRRSGGRFEAVGRWGRGEQARSVLLDGLTFAVSDVFS